MINLEREECNVKREVLEYVLKCDLCDLLLV